MEYWITIYLLCGVALVHYRTKLKADPQDHLEESLDELQRELLIETGLEVSRAWAKVAVLFGFFLLVMIWPYGVIRILIKRRS